VVAEAMKRTPLKRKTPLRASRVLRVDGSHFMMTQPPHVKRKTKHARRERAPAYMAWVKTLPCYVVALRLTFATPCRGVVEADHAGSKMSEGDGLRAYDHTCIPLCTGHHRERHDFCGTFEAFDQQQMRVFLSTAIAHTRLTAMNQGVEVPLC
jgi:hypothetical protein